MRDGRGRNFADRLGPSFTFPLYWDEEHFFVGLDSERDTESVLSGLDRAEVVWAHRPNQVTEPPLAEMTALCEEHCERARKTSAYKRFRRELTGRTTPPKRWTQPPPERKPHLQLVPDLEPDIEPPVYPGAYNPNPPVQLSTGAWTAVKMPTGSYAFVGDEWYGELVPVIIDGRWLRAHVDPNWTPEQRGPMAVLDALYREGLVT